MTDHDRAAALLLDALDCPPEARRAWLAHAVEDEAVRARVLALLDAHEAAEIGGPLDTPLLVREGRRGGHRVGPWRLVEPLGEGGMGTVWKAERADGTYDRSVALKLLRVDGNTDALAERLRAERQILARLEHPNVARLYDGGVTEDGRPYLVLERVDGQPITAYADAHGLDVPARLHLFLQVCGAVAYAHQNLVVHRDLKPSNVFVTADGRVKLLDFGIAKLVEDERDDLLTRSQLALTPSYAAPEQVRRAPVTTTTDVYALGVMLYELLAGQRPFTLTSLTAAEVERTICDTDAAPPSALAPPARARAVRGDLDVIVAKAMEKDPARRYATANALAADVRRHLDGLPVVARPPTAAYRTGRFVRRHRAGVAAALALALALVGGLAGTAWQARKARGEAAKAEAVNDFLVEMLGAPDPTTEGRDVRVAAVLDRAGARIDSAFAAQPDVAAAMHRTLGTVYREMGLYAEARPHLEAAHALQERLARPTDRARIEALSDLGDLALLQDSLALADSLLTRALADARAGLPARDLAFSTLLSTLGYVRYLEGDLAASLALHREAVAIQEAQPAPDSVEVAASLGNVAVVLTDLGRPAEAIPVLERQVAIYRRRLGPDNSRVARALNNLSSACYEADRLDEALRAAEEAVALYRRTLPPESPEIAQALSNLAPIQAARGDAAGAERSARAALAIYEPALGATHGRTTAARIKLGQVLQAGGATAEAERTLRTALAAADANTPEGHPQRTAVRLALGGLLVETDRPDDAVPFLRAALAQRRAALAADHPEVAVAASQLGDALQRGGHMAEAAPLLREAHAALVRSPGPTHRLTRDAAARLAALPR